MKNIVRATVIVLALTGAAASTQISSASAQNNTASVQNSVLMGKMSAMPKPACPLNDPTGCDIAK